MIKPSEKQSTTIQTIAPETLFEIFKHCLPIDHDQCSICDASRAPLLLGRVCNRWRMISVSSPHLWSRFALLAGQLSRMDCKSALDVTNRWISRTGSQPLSIYFHYDSSFRYEKFLPKGLELVASLSLRWKDIKICIPSGFIGVTFAPFWFGHLPHLENFESTIFDFHNVEVVHWLDLSTAPQLQTFHQSRGWAYILNSAIECPTSRISRSKIRSQECLFVICWTVFCTVLCLRSCTLTSMKPEPAFRKNFPPSSNSTISVISPCACTPKLTRAICLTCSSCPH
ncbi:hypothetical protein BD410DRAFT_510348 [Rickenella mellea]|uniref:F-box domain-containing protein n=1 Tax=Rickenella mellea TaxID=50990 RepID=A0A4Y7PST6_9AGAM|nr:hypothetical protein BD410DRAFT_510348 [Rickenella mellea]